MFASLILIALIAFLPCEVTWLSLQPEVIALQTLVVYYVIRLGLIKNLYQLAGYSALFLVALGVYLFYLQFDVFACFLLVAESIVILFIVSILMHFNYTNIQSKSQNRLWVLCFIPVYFTYLNTSTDFNYWVYWYQSQISQYNDLLPQFIYLYYMDEPVVLLTAIWLVILTLLLVHLILNNMLEKSTHTTNIIYTRKTQNIWSQWYKKPFIRFFQK